MTATPGPWKVVDNTMSGSGYIEIRGPNDEAICTIFPGTGRGSVGIEAALANAQLLAAARKP